MHTAETAPTAEQVGELKGKSLLLIASPNPTKRHLFQRLKSLGVKLTVMSSESSWASRSADAYIECSLDAQDAIARPQEVFP